MLEFSIFLAGAVTCFITLYFIGKQKHKGHTGPSSKAQTKETVVPVLKKG